MTPPLENHHVCTACGQSYPVTALVCRCGGREFVPVELETGGTRVGARLGIVDEMNAEVVARHKRMFGERPSFEYKPPRVKR